jgi:chemotaxis response regulator CheB
MQKIRLVVVDDQTVVREGLVAMFAGYPDIEVVGQAADGVQAMQVIQETRPDVVTLDLVMPVHLYLQY